VARVKTPLKKIVDKKESIWSGNGGCGEFEADLLK